MRGSYDDVNRLCTSLDEFNWAFVNINVRRTTRGIAVARVLDRGAAGGAPPTHRGTDGVRLHVHEIWKGLKEFHQVGLIEMPHT